MGSRADFPCSGIRILCRNIVVFYCWIGLFTRLSLPHFGHLSSLAMLLFYTVYRILAMPFFKWPYSDGRSRQGAPVRKTQKTSLMNYHVFFAFPPRVPFSPIVCSLIFSQALSLISYQCNSLFILGFPYFLFLLYHVLLTTLSKAT